MNIKILDRWIFLPAINATVFNWHFYCSNKLDLKNLQLKKHFASKIVLAFQSSNKLFQSSQNCGKLSAFSLIFVKVFSQSREHFFHVIGQKKFQKKIPFLVSLNFISSQFSFILQGSPIGRSSTPIDCAGSPHSPSGNGGGVGGPPQSYPDAMAMAGPNYQHFMELTNDVQKLSVVCD